MNLSPGLEAVGWLESFRHAGLFSANLDHYYIHETGLVLKTSRQYGCNNFNLTRQL